MTRQHRSIFPNSKFPMNNDIADTSRHLLSERSEIPEVARYWPPKAAVHFMQRISAKCRVIRMPDEGGCWIEAGGSIPVETGEGYPEDASRGGVGLDTSQARTYFRKEGSNPVCRVILPDDYCFRDSRKGMVKGRSKSFDDDGNPVPEVLLLYALKTGSYDDRLRAVEAFPSEIWDAETFGKLFGAMDDAARTDHHFGIFAGEQLAQSARQENGLSDWLLWEKVADAAAALKREMLARAKLKVDPLNRSLFLQAVKETTIELQGLTTQNHVNKRWQKLGGHGEWREIRRTFGFDWLPSEADWKKSWTVSS